MEQDRKPILELENEGKTCVVDGEKFDVYLKASPSERRKMKMSEIIKETNGEE